MKFFSKYLNNEFIFNNNISALTKIHTFPAFKGYDEDCLEKKEDEYCYGIYDEDDEDEYDEYDEDDEDEEDEYEDYYEEDDEFYYDSYGDDDIEEDDEYFYEENEEFYFNSCDGGEGYEKLYCDSCDTNDKGEYDSDEERHDKYKNPSKNHYGYNRVSLSMLEIQKRAIRAISFQKWRAFFSLLVLLALVLLPIVILRYVVGLDFYIMSYDEIMQKNIKEPLLVFCLYIYSFLISGICLYGLAAWALTLCRYDRLEFRTILSGFKHPIRSIALFTLVYLYLAFSLSPLFFIFIIAFLRYSLVIFVSSDNPRIFLLECIKETGHLTNKNIKIIFKLFFSLILLWIASIITLGIFLFLAIPYFIINLAVIYIEIIGEEIDVNKLRNDSFSETCIDDSKYVNQFLHKSKDYGENDPLTELGIFFKKKKKK